MEELYKKFNYPSAAKFHKMLKDEGVNISLNQVKEFLANQSVIKLLIKTAISLNILLQILLMKYFKNHTQFMNGKRWIAH